MLQNGRRKNLMNSFSPNPTVVPHLAPPGYQWKLTNDGSWSLYSENFHEATHSDAGAWTETIVRYVEGCKLKEKWDRSEQLAILEVGVGTGTGLVAVLRELQSIKKYSPKASLIYVGLEIDEQLIVWIKEHIETLFQENIIDFAPLKGLKRQSHGECITYTFKNESIDICILVGDAKATLVGWENKIKFHAIFQDAFSPKNNPDLWDAGWFSVLKDCGASDVILSTFSAASRVKQALSDSGWNVQEGPKFGQKRGSILASLNY